MRELEILRGTLLKIKEEYTNKHKLTCDHIWAYMALSLGETISIIDSMIESKSKESDSLEAIKVFAIILDETAAAAEPQSKDKIYWSARAEGIRDAIDILTSLQP